MKWASAISSSSNLEYSIKECVESIKTQLGSAPVDFTIIFISPHFSERYPDLPGLILERLPSPHLIGCSGGGIIGGGKEIEHAPALSITAASLPGVRVETFYKTQASMPKLDTTPKVWEEWIGIKKELNPQFVILADPQTLQADHLLMGMDYAYPQSVKIGGLVSGAGVGGTNVLFLNKNVYQEGVCGTAFSGNIILDTIVAQGCRPIGEVFQVTKCDRNLLIEVNHRPVVGYLRDLNNTLSPEDQQLLQRSLFIGIVMDPLKTHFSQGDFLIRNIMGLDAKKETLVVGAFLREGQTLQFHLRDSKTSAEDLEDLISNYIERGHPEKLKGALLFSCLGRGEHLYGKPDHDTQVFQENLGSIPVGGFFCNGEIGPVGSTTFLHGYTSSFGLFRTLTP